MRLPHTVTKVTPAATEDRRGDADLDYGDAATRTQIRAWVQQVGQALTGRERLGDFTARDSTWLMFYDDPTLDVFDRVEWGGHTFRLNGQPTWIDYGTAHGEAQLDLLEV